MRDAPESFPITHYPRPELDRSGRLQGQSRRLDPRSDGEPRNGPIPSSGTITHTRHLAGD